MSDRFDEMAETWFAGLRHLESEQRARRSLADFLRKAIEDELANERQRHVTSELHKRTEGVLNAVREARAHCIGPNVPPELRAVHEAMGELDFAQATIAD